MKCEEKECRGQVRCDNSVRLLVGRASFDFAYPCNICGRLYWYNGIPVGRRGKKAFFKNAKIVYKNDQNQPV